MSNTVAPRASTPSPNVKLVGRYSVLRELRRDRYTTVYLAFDPVLNRELIIKSVQLDPTQAQDRPVVARLAPAPRLPAVTHVDTASRTIEVTDLPVVLIVRDQADAAMLHGEQVDAARTDLVPIRSHIAPHAQARDAAVRKNV